MSVVYYDATMILHWGFETAVGIVRVEHYAVNCLINTPAIELKFVRFDADGGTYREVTGEEAETIGRVVSSLRGEKIATRNPPSRGNLEPAIAETPIEPRDPLSARLGRFAAAAAAVPRGEVGGLVRRWLDHAVPTPPGAGFVRRGMAGVVRLGLHIFAMGANLLGRFRARTPSDAAAGLGAGDDGLATGRFWLEAAFAPARPPPAASVAWAQGDVLVCAGNPWDYLDYGQLPALAALGVRLVAVCYDVIVVEHPSAAAAPPDRLHRNFVEMAHYADTILTVSETSKAAFERVICAPNGLDCAIVAARVPNLLFVHAAEIGETPTAALLGRRFVVFCATIEVRKNHQLLLQVWERLAQRLSPDDLPILVFVGKWGWRTEQVAFYAAHEHRLRSKLRIYTKASDAELIWLYRNAEFALSPSFYEGLGNIEPLTFGTPLITSDHPAMIEATEGLMPALDPLDGPAWVAEIERLLTDPAHLAALRAAARRFCNPGPSTFGDALVAAVSAPDRAAQEGRA
jgi:glycosyltransferase involved in cell wall biosynthesis